MRVFMTKRFAKYAEDEAIEIDSLIAAVHDIDAGRNEGRWSDLGGDVYKLRVARAGKGSSGGYRVILLLRRGDKAFMARGFAKNKMANINVTELRLYKQQAKDLLNWDEIRLEAEKLLRNIKEIFDV